MGLVDWAKRKLAEKVVKDEAAKFDTPEKAKAMADGILEGGSTMSDSTKAWFKSLAAAAFGGAVGSVSQMLVDPQVLWTPVGQKQLLAGGLAGAFLAVSGLLKQSPLPPKA